MEYQPTIGLEVHAELKTLTKMFCDSKNDPDEHHPNTNVCPVCLGHPGTLPVINKKAVESVIRVGLALGGTIAPRTKFDRKNYFYPDLPKGYQISQYDMPLVSGGELCGVRIRRIHLEEDTGTLGHHDDNNNDKNNLNHSHSSSSLVDFNRAGVPLMELVTEPDIRDSETAVRFAKELQLILRTLHVSDANMEKGQMRVEVNISMNMGTKAEIKNINSFKAVEGAIAYEIERQQKALEEGHLLRQETRGWDDVRRVTVSQRIKEDAHDYRYFPEPDLPPFGTEAFDLSCLRAELPELPRVKRVRFAEEFSLPEKAVDLLVSEPELASYFEESVSELRAESPKASVQLLFNYATSDLRGLMNERRVSFSDVRATPEHLAHLVRLIEKGVITSRQAKDILVHVIETGLDPEAVMKEKGFAVVSDEVALITTVKSVIADNPKAAEDYKNGKMASLQFLIGQGMKALKGQARPDVLKELFEKELK